MFQDRPWASCRPRRADVSVRAPRQENPMCPLEAWQAEGVSSLLLVGKVSLFVLFKPSTDWMRLTHTGEDNPVSLLIQMLISPGNTLTDTPRVPFD